MARGLVKAWLRFVERALAGLFAVLALIALVVTLLWRDRVPLDDIPLPPPPGEATRGDRVSVTWFGVTTLLFDDGETQLLIDGFVSRPTAFRVLARRPVRNDIAKINWFLNEYDVRRLAAIIPSHSHYDHAMDVGAIANRTGATVLGSNSTARIANAAGVPREQVIVASQGTEYRFGRFTVHLIPSAHAPIGWNGSVPVAGEIEDSIALPAPATVYREGGSYSIVISHPAGKALVQGSAGLPPAALEALHIDTVFLGVGMLESLGRSYIEEYWRATVTATGATTVVPIHFDDYTQPFGTVLLAPKFLDDFSVTTRILNELRRRWDSDSRLYLPRFGVAMPLKAAQSSAA